MPIRDHPNLVEPIIWSRVLRNMKRDQISFIVVLVTVLVATAPFGRAQDTAAQRISPPRNWVLSFTRYSEFREGSDSLPIKVTSIRGGKLSPDEKFRIEVMGLLNRSTKSVTSAEFTWYLFDNADLDKALDSGMTPTIKTGLVPDGVQRVQFFILYLEDIPYLKDRNPPGTFLLEVAITKVTYDDGSTWEATGFPHKMDYSKVRNQ